jgi:tetratricopeptide (TPR) repeat protein
MVRCGVRYLAMALMLLAPSSPRADPAAALREAARLEDAGKPAAAVESYQRVLGEAGERSPERARALAGLSGVEADLGRYTDAAAHGREAAALFTSLGDAAGAAMALNRAGLASLYAGRYAEAEQVLRAALDVSSRIRDEEGRAEQLGNLANVQFFVGRYADAAHLYDEALAVTAASHDQPWAARRQRLILANQASLYQRLGRNEQALTIYRQLGAPDSDLRPRERAQLLLNLGVLYRRLGDPVKALETYDQARGLFQQDRHVDGELGALKNRGIVLALDLGRLADAERSFEAALDGATRTGNRREMLHARLYLGETRLREGRPDDATADFSAGLALARELATPEEEWKALYGLGRATGDEDRRITYFRKSITTIERMREQIRVPSLRSDFLTDKREVYDALFAARRSTGSASELFEILERSHSRVWRDRLGLSAPVELGAVQAALPQGVLLLDYWQAPAGSAVVAVTRSRASVIQTNAQERDIRALVDALAGPSSDWMAPARRLSALIPPADWLDGIDHVVVVPDGLLALVPFELLHAGDRPLIAHAAVSYTPTAGTVLRETQASAGWRWPWRSELRVFADPVFSDTALDDAEEVRRGVRGTRAEATLIAHELSGRTVFHVGADNQKRHLLDGGQTAPLLHLATHAFADATAMEQSRILFSPAASGTTAADYLFLNEAYELPLKGVELAVLSACDTGRGPLARGEGVQSFSRAFLAAGARSTVTTLWRVADSPTAQLMGVFYHHLQRGVPRDQALRLAKLRFLEGGTPLAHPHYWAAFVISGNAQHPVPRAISWAALAAAVATALAVSGAVVLASRRMRRR